MNIEKILSIWKRYVNIRKELREAGILFTNRQPEADFSEFIVSKLLNAKLVDSSVQKDYDIERVVHGHKIKYQVKSLSKSIGNPNGYIIKEKDKNSTSDYYVFVFYNPDFTPKRIYLVESKFVKEFKKRQIRERDLIGKELKIEQCVNKELFSKIFCNYR